MQIVEEVLHNKDLLGLILSHIYPSKLAPLSRVNKIWKHVVEQFVIKWLQKNPICIGLVLQTAIDNDDVTATKRYIELAQQCNYDLQRYKLQVNERNRYNLLNYIIKVPKESSSARNKMAELFVAAGFSLSNDIWYGSNTDLFIIEHLIEKKYIDPNSYLQYCNLQWSWLGFAIAQEDVSLVRMLLNNKASLDNWCCSTVNRFDGTDYYHPLDYAEKMENKDITNALLSEGKIRRAKFYLCKGPHDKVLLQKLDKLFRKALSHDKAHVREFLERVKKGKVELTPYQITILSNVESIKSFFKDYEKPRIKCFFETLSEAKFFLNPSDIKIIKTPQTDNYLADELNSTGELEEPQIEKPISLNHKPRQTIIEECKKETLNAFVKLKQQVKNSISNLNYQPSSPRFFQGNTEVKGSEHEEVNGNNNNTYTNSK